MSDRFDRLVELLDVGVQSSRETGYGTDASPDFCARCQLSRIDDGDLCGGCRSFLLGDTDVDPNQVVTSGTATEWLRLRPGDRVVPTYTLTVGGQDLPNCGSPLGFCVDEGCDREYCSLRVDATQAMRHVDAAVSTSGTDLEGFTAAMRQLAATIVEIFTPAIEYATAAFRSLVEHGVLNPDGTPVEQQPKLRLPSQTAREWERALLAEHRRSHRRTNRWPQPPGR